MRLRLTVLLSGLMAVVIVALGVPLGSSIAAGRARDLYADRLADVTRFAGLVPADSRPGAPEELLLELAQYERLYGIPTAVLNTDGSVRFASSRHVPLDTPSGREAAAAALAGRTSRVLTDLRPWDGTPLAVGQPVVRDGDVVGAVVSVTFPDAARRNLLLTWTQLALAAAVAMGAVVLLARRLADWVLRPVEQLDAAVVTMAEGDFDTRVDVAHGPPELLRLGRSFTWMATRVKEAFVTQQAFVADASHQLRNPLGALLLRLEAAAALAQRAEQEGSPVGVRTAVRDAVREAAQDGRYLATTLDRMLELARAEHTSAAAGTIDVGAVVDARLPSWTVVAAGRDIEVRRMGLTHAFAWGEPAALAGAFDAVVDNALKYGPAHSVVRVTVQDDGPTVAVVVEDEGTGLAPEDLPRAKDRFWRSPAQAAVPGSGLGLPIATTLLSQYGGRLDISPRDPRGVRVRLELPRGSEGPAGPPVRASPQQEHAHRP